MRSRQKVRERDAGFVHKHNQTVRLRPEPGIDPVYTVGFADAKGIYRVNCRLLGESRNRQLPGRSGAQKAMQQDKVRSRPALR